MNFKKGLVGLAVVAALASGCSRDVTMPKNIDDGLTRTDQLEQYGALTNYVKVVAKPGERADQLVSRYSTGFPLKVMLPYFVYDNNLTRGAGAISHGKEYLVRTGNFVPLRDTEGSKGE